jgi:hypothetical protein
MTLATVTYDRKTGEYVVRNGREIARLPRGRANRLRAEWIAVQYDGPTVYEAAQAMLAENAHVAGYEQRLLKAAQIVVSGGVRPGWVKSQSTDSWYAVEPWGILGLHCQCVDWEQGREARFNDRSSAAPVVAGQTCCKHVLATILAERKADVKKADIAQVAARKLADWTEALAERSRGAKGQSSKVAELPCHPATLPPCPTCNGRGQYTGVNCTWQPACPMCGQRPATTLDGYCEPCQNQIDTPDTAELDLGGYLPTAGGW